MAEQEPVYRIVAENATTCRNILARGGCDRCALRHCAPPWALYDAAPATLRGALRSALDVPQNEGCALCLGALAETTAQAVVHASSEHAGLGAARGWALRVAAPPSWAVRDAAVLCRVEIKFRAPPRRRRDVVPSAPWRENPTHRVIPHRSAGRRTRSRTRCGASSPRTSTAWRRPVIRRPRRLRRPATST